MIVHTEMGQVSAHTLCTKHRTDVFLFVRDGPEPWSPGAALAMAPEHAREVAELLRREADRAEYTMKQRGQYYWRPWFGIFGKPQAGKSAKSADEG